MNFNEAETADTFGTRLDRETRRAIAKRLPKLAWLRNLEPVMERVSRATKQFHERFERREADIAPISTGMPLPFHLRSGVERVTGPGAATVRVHDGPAADLVAAAHHAEAVTAGPDVFFRKGH